MGPTAAGKTALAMALAERLPVDLISVDSAMVYRGMDIGTAKPTAAERRRHPHHLIDIRDPAERYSVAEFLADARRVVEASLARRRVPLLVGGTMLYFKAFKSGMAALPATSDVVRERLAERARREGLASLHRELAQIDPVAAAGIHPNNPQRLLRALEVFESSGRPISHWWAEQTAGGVAAELDCDLIEFCIAPERSVLTTRIEARLTEMWAAGFVDEVRGLRDRGDLERELPAMRAVGYRQVWDHLEGITDEEEMRRRALRATRQLAKRQMTWLNAWRDHRLVDPLHGDPLVEILHYLDTVAILDRL